MKKTLCLFLSTFMLISVLSLVALGASIINLVDLDGIVPPSVNASPDWDIGTNDSDYEVVNVEWFDRERSVDMQPGEKFLAGHSYRLKIYVVTNNGFEFRTDGVSGEPIVAIIHNGDQIDDFYCIDGNESQLLVQIDYDTLPAAESNTINEVVITVNQPFTGMVPSFTKIDTSEYYSDGNISPESKGVKWYDVTDGKYLISGTGAKFTCGHTYRVSFSLNTKGDYEFGNAIAKVNGKTAELDWYNSNLVIVTYTFNELACAPQFVQGEFPSCNGTGHVGYYACACGKWYWDDEGTDLIEDEEEIVIPPTGAHIYEKVVTKATTSKNGKIETKCSGCGDVTETQTIAKISSVALSKTQYTYDGKIKTPSVTVKGANGNALVKGTDYTVKYATGRKNTGKYAVTVTFMGNYEGTKTLYFTIIPKSVTGVKATQTTTSVKLSWDKVTGATGYRIFRYNTSTKKWDIIVRKTTGTSYTVKDLKPGTKYLFSVRNYKTVNGTIYWSAAGTRIQTATKTVTPAISRLTTGSKYAKLTWANVSGETGWQVYCSATKDGTYKKYSNYAANTTGATVKNLTSGRTYYFKVRTYTKTGSGYVYSDFSPVKSIKVK